MSTRQYRKSRVSGFILPVSCLLVLAYFIYHAQIGKYGIHAMRAMDVKANELKLELAQIRLEREAIARKVALLSDGTLEADALDENARKILGLAQSDEVVIFH